MTRYVAFLRGVSPMNCSMPALTACLEAAGYDEVRTLLSSGNVAFSTRETALAELELEVEEAMLAGMGCTFPTIVRTSASLQSLVARNPFLTFDTSPTAKPVITFLRRAAAHELALPLEQDGARVLAIDGAEVLSVYEPDAGAPTFMAVLERTFGKEITTRTLGTVERCARA